jgi:hypothetical protein
MTETCFEQRRVLGRVEMVANILIAKAVHNVLRAPIKTRAPLLFHAVFVSRNV